MPNPEPINLVQRIFDYLFDDFGFTVTEAKNFDSFGNWVVVLQLEKNCRIRIFQDRGSIMVSFGPAWSPPGWEAGPWYDISVVLTEFGETTNNLSRNVKSSKIQLEMFSQIIRPLIPRICNLFSTENYEKRKDDLEQIKNRFEDETWDRLIRKD